MGKKVAIMQPYFFPYMGYLELAKLVDHFIFLDDVNFIKKGWINRNQVRNRTGVIKFNIPLSGISQNKLIKDTMIYDYGKFTSDIMQTLNSCYGNVANFSTKGDCIYEMVAGFQGKSVADFNVYSLRWAFRKFGLNCTTARSSELKINANLTGEDRIIALCKEFGADTYVNPIGGAHLYNEQNFRKYNIGLVFHEYNPIRYKQFKLNDFIPGLSYIDYFMFNDVCSYH